LWSLATGVIAQRLHAGTQAMCFSPDSHRIYLRGNAIWDIAAHTDIARTGPNTSSWCTPEGNRYWKIDTRHSTIDQADYFHQRWTVQLRDIASDRTVRTLKGLIGGSISCRQGCSIVALPSAPPASSDRDNASYASAYTVWNLDARKALTRLAVTGADIKSRSFTLSADGRRCAACCEDAQHQNAVLVWETHTGRLLCNIPVPDAYSFDFSPNALRLSGIVPQRKDNAQAVVWDIATGQVLATLALPPRTSPAAGGSCLTFASNGKRLLTWTGTKMVQCWDLQTGKVVDALNVVTAVTDADLKAVTTPQVPFLGIHAQGSRQSWVKTPETFTLWDLSSGRVSKQLALSKEVHDLAVKAITPDGCRVLGTAQSTAGCLIACDLASGTISTSRPPATTGDPNGLSWREFTPDGAYAISGYRDADSLTLWKTNGWQVANTIPIGHNYPRQFSFSHDRSKIAWCSVRRGEKGQPSNDQLSLYDIPSGQLTTWPVTKRDHAAIVAFNPDDKTISLMRMTGERNETAMAQALCRINLATGQKVDETPLPRMLRKVDGLVDIVSTDDVHLIGLRSLPRELVLWNRRTKRVTSIPYTANTIQLVFDKMLITHNRQENRYDLWDIRRLFDDASPRPRASLYTFSNGLWLVTTPEGYFDCSPEVTKTIRWEKDGQSYPYEKFAATYHRPDLVQQALSVPAN
ncbi:MAG TPA: WD40 repeat domain-containing protein, partial [Armatimonadota bacterium]